MRGHQVVPDPAQQPTMDLWPDVARAFDISRSSVYAAAASGDIPTIRIGHRLKVPTAAVRQMLQLDVADRQHLSAAVGVIAGGAATRD